MTNTDEIQNPLSSFANAYAGLLQQLSTIPQIAALDSYAKGVVGRDRNELTSTILADLSAENAMQIYSDALPGGVDKTDVKLWSNQAEHIESLNSKLKDIDDVAKVAWLKGYGIDVNSPHLKGALMPKVTEILGDPNTALSNIANLSTAKVDEVIVANTDVVVDSVEAPAVEAVAVPEEIVVAPKLEEAAVENADVLETPEQNNKEEVKTNNDLQNSVAAFVGTLLTTVRGEETVVTSEESAALIAEYSKQFEGDSVSKKHVLDAALNNFSQHSDDAKRDIIMSSMVDFAKQYKQDISIASAQEEMAKLQPNDIVAMLDSLESIPSPKYTKNIESLNMLKAQECSAPEKPKSFTERVSQPSSVVQIQ